MPYPASIFERQRQLSTSLSTSTPSQSKMMRSGWVIAGFPSRSEHILRKWAITQVARGGDQLNVSEGPPVASKPAQSPTAERVVCRIADCRMDGPSASLDDIPAKYA